MLPFFQPISARSNATSVTLLATDVEVEEMKEKFSTVRSDNARLRTLVTQLRQQLAEAMKLFYLAIAIIKLNQLLKMSSLHLSCSVKFVFCLFRLSTHR